MAVFVIALTEEEQRVVNAERDSHPEAHVRRKMLVVWLLHCGLTRTKAAQIADLSRPTVQRYVAAFRTGGLDGLCRWGVRGPVSDLVAHTSAIRRLNAALTNPFLTFRRSDRVIGTPFPITDAAGNVLGIEVSFQSGAKEIFGMMLWCVGFGEERRFAPPNYTGFAFWETDPFEQPNWGMPSPPSGCRALVSGGGDGALQDVIRLATRRKSAIDVWRDIEVGGWSMPQEARHVLFTAEDQAQRALLWCRRSSADEHNALQRLHDAYLQVVDDLTTLHPARALLIEEVEKLLAANQFPILCVYPCTHFARCYSLNHFLVLLLAKVVTLRNLAGGPELRPQLGVSDVLGHPCAANPWTCHGAAHIVNMQHRPLCFHPPGGAAGQLDAHVLVIRHGIAPHPAFFSTPMAFARQVMPYHLP